MLGKTLVCSALLLPATQVLAQADWEEPFPPHQMIDNVYYVGTSGLATFLVVTDAGHILINSDFERTVPTLKQNVEALGFKFEDIEVILGSHAHGDHMEGDALAKELSGAEVMAMEQDLPLLRSMRPGGKEHPIDRVLHDGDTVELGGETLTAVLTPGHTPGCTTWTLQVEENGMPHNVFIACSNVGYVLIDDSGTAAGNAAAVRTLPVDVFLGAHGFIFDLAEKHAKLQSGAPNPYIDPEGFLAHIE